ncbi:MAG TPA: sugar transferase [Thermoanaerobaculia bacterium]|nr:sugar transferase [Thermoanaerobaculia bacterium]
MTRSHSAFRPTALAGDVAIAALCLYGAFLLRTRMALPGTEGLLPLGKVRYSFVNVLLVVCAQAFFLSLFGLYRARERFREPLARLLVPALFFELFALSAVYFLAFAQAYLFPRSVLVVYILLDAVALGIWRMLLDRLFPQPRRRAVIVGTGKAASLIADTIRRHPWTGVEVVGLIGAAGGGRADLPVLGPVEGLIEISEREKIDEVIVTPEESSWKDRISERVPRDWQTDLLVWPSPFETMIGRLRFRIVGDLPLLEARTRPLEGIGAALKRAFDVIVSAGLLVAFLPILLIAALIVAITSRGGIFYRQERVGKDGCPFQLWKLRTMREGAEGKTGAVFSSPGDPRVTSAGRWLRSLRFDEIPQLWNVFIGDMSLVGPRPERPEFTRPLEEAVSGYKLRLSARPGLTGLAQVSGDYATEPEIKLRYDLAYLNNWSLGLDLSILLRTIPVILTRRGV